MPGTIDFEILEPLDEGEDASMTVGIALSSNVSPAPACSIEDAGATPSTRRPIRSGEELLDWDGNYADYELIGSTRLDAGRVPSGVRGRVESAAASGVSFTVGRVLAVDDVTDQIGPILGIFGAMGIAGLLFVVGIALLIVGLVQRSRSGRSSAPDSVPRPVPQASTQVSTRRASTPPGTGRGRAGSVRCPCPLTARPVTAHQHPSGAASRPVPAAAGPGHRPTVAGRPAARSADRGTGRDARSLSHPTRTAPCQVGQSLRASAGHGLAGRSRPTDFRKGSEPYRRDAVSSGAAGYSPCGSYTSADSSTPSA